MQGPNMGLGPALSPLLLFYLSFLSLIFVTVESGFFPGKSCHILMHTHRQPGFWHLYHVLVSAI